MASVAPETRFMGAVTALTMHEMQNVLAIIRESAGLLGDILRINAGVPFKHRENMDRSLEHIRQHVERGKALLEATSRLAHSPDDDQLERCDLVSNTRAVVQLALRPARLKCAGIDFTPPGVSLPVAVGALHVLMAGYQAVLCALGRSAPRESMVRLELQRGEAWHVLAVGCPPGAEPDPEARQRLARFLEESGGQLEAGPDRLELRFPALR